jgi:hypothetical protein
MQFLLQLSDHRGHNVGAFFPNSDRRCAPEQVASGVVQTVEQSPADTASQLWPCDIRAAAFSKATSVLSTHNLRILTRDQCTHCRFRQIKA